MGELHSPGSPGASFRQRRPVESVIYSRAGRSTGGVFGVLARAASLPSQRFMAKVRAGCFILTYPDHW
jgi:hypothetical protein